MKTALLLGPNFWRSRWRRGSPMHLRTRARAALAPQNFKGILMEDVPDRDDEHRYPDKKFKRLLDALPLDAVIVVWPRRAKMQTVFIELVILAQRELAGKALPLYYLAHPKAAGHQNGRFRIHERGGRSTYLNGTERLAPTLYPWRNPAELHTAMERCAHDIIGWPPPTPIASADPTTLQETNAFLSTLHLFDC